METQEHKELKQKLLNNEVSFIEVKDKLLELDQSDIYRAASENNLAFLSDNEIVDYISCVEEEIKKEYYNFLSFTEFHVAQRLAINGNNEVALSHFRKSLEYSQNACSFEGWNNYIMGNIMYLEGSHIPEEIIESIEPESEANAEILKNFNNGLHTRGYPSYAVDYAK